MTEFDIAAFSRRASGGLIPQARHGGSELCTFAVTGSKFVGNGFESEHIGHTHVVLRGRALQVEDGEDLCGLEALAREDAVAVLDGPLTGRCKPELPIIA